MQEHQTSSSKFFQNILQSFQQLDGALVRDSLLQNCKEIESLDSDLEGSTNIASISAVEQPLQEQAS